MARGDFTATDLGRITARLNTLFNGDRYRAQLNLPYGSVREALARQTASFNNIEVNGVCRGVKAWYLKDCIDTMLDCTTTPITDCAVTGNQVESVAINFDVNDCIHEGVTVYDDECADNAAVAAEKVAFGMAKFYAKVRAELNARYVAFNVANATDWAVVGAPEYGTPGVVTTELEFATALWVGDIIGKLKWVSDANGGYEAFMLDGGNLWLQDFKAQFETGGCCTVDSIGSGPIDVIYDTKTIRNITGKKSAFLVDPDAYAFWSRNYYQSTVPVPMLDEHNSFVWKAAVPGLQFASGGSLQNIYVDWIRQRQCEIVGGQHRWKTVYHGKVHFAFVLGPDICATSETGIMHVTEV